MIRKQTILLSTLLMISSFCQASYPQNDEHFYHLERKDRQTNEIVDPSMIVVNYTVQPTLVESVLALKTGRVSTHYMIDNDGSIYETMHQTPKQTTTVDKDYVKRRAWHAGHGWWNGDKQETSDMNSHSIGILLVNEGATPKDNPNVLTTDASNTTQWFNFSLQQKTAFVALCKQLKDTYKIADKDIVGHGEVAINPTTKSLGRKIGPGPRFPWQASAQEGVSLFHTLTEEELSQPCNHSVTDLQKALLAWGYSVKVTEQEDEQTKQALLQAQIHHDSQHINGDTKSCRIPRIMENLIKQHLDKKQ